MIYQWHKLHHANIMIVIAYCGIWVIIVHWEPMFVDFVGHPYPQIYIPTAFVSFICVYLINTGVDLPIET